MECINRRGSDGLPHDLVDFDGAVAVFVFKGMTENEGPVDWAFQLVILVFGVDKALYYHVLMLKGLGYDMLSYSKCYEDTVDNVLSMLRFYMRKVEEGMYDLIDRRVMPGYEDLFSTLIHS